MTRLWMSFMAILSVTTAQAESVRVLGGSHPDFTRLILDFEFRPAWSTEKNENGYSIEFEADDLLTFDFSGAYRVMESLPLALRAAGNRIEIDFACPCEADFRNLASDAVVIDIRETTTAAPKAVFEVAPKRPAPPNVGQLAVQLPKPSDWHPNNVVSRPNVALPDRAIQDLELPVTASASVLGDLGLVFQSETESQAVEFLSQELSRAVAQGLVEPGAISMSGSSIAGAATAINLPPNSSNLSVTTGFDREVMALRDRVPPTYEGSVCFSDSEVDLAAWGDTASAIDLGRLRGDAIAESGVILPRGAEAIARYYVALGFGAEAIFVANAMEDGQRKTLVRALGDIVDHGQTSSNVLDGQIFCEGKVALWAALARPIDRKATPVSAESILATFSALPPHLRTHLGPVLVERLRTVGMDIEARNAINAVSRGGSQSGESKLASAKLGLSGTEDEAARDILADLSNGTDITAAEALLELLDDASRRGLPPNPDWVRDAPSLVRATLGTEVSELLSIAGLRGRIALGQFDKLRQALGEMPPGIDENMLQQLASEAIVAAARNADTEVFLRAEIGFSKVSPQPIMSREDRFQVANRLYDMSLADRALTYLPQEPFSPSEAVAAADILVATGDTTGAIDLLMSHPDDESNLRLGAILSGSGQGAAAIPAYMAGGQPEKAQQTAMRVGNWEWIASRESDVSQSARALLNPSEPSEPGAPTNGLLIQSSVALRQHADTLLGAAPATGFSFTN